MARTFIIIALALSPWALAQGQECGMAFENYNDIQIGDQIECFAIEEIAREL